MERQSAAVIIQTLGPCPLMKPNDINSPCDEKNRNSPASFQWLLAQNISSASTKTAQQNATPSAIPLLGSQVSNPVPAPMKTAPVSRKALARRHRRNRRSVK